LSPGPGVGGHCIAVDPWFIVDSAPDDTELIRAARKVNDGKPGRVAARVKAAAARHKRPTVACLGLAYKADIDDVRESPAIAIVAELATLRDVRLLVVEPYLDALPPMLASLKGMTKADLDEALAAADIVVLLTDHRQFRAVDRARLSGKTIIDTRGAWR
jgi:UDP-N-acetyl-D-mannosaminuronic acid dehydrogenase